MIAMRELFRGFRILCALKWITWDASSVTALPLTRFFQTSDCALRSEEDRFGQRGIDEALEYRAGYARRVSQCGKVRG